MNYSDTEEIWKTIPGYSLYEASTFGRIKTFNWKNKGIEAIMKPHADACGYLRTMLKRDSDGKIGTIKVHRIIALTFWGTPEVGFDDVNHKNSNRSDNSVNNLEWVSKSQNTLHAFREGNKSVHGDKNPCATLTNDQVREIRANYQFGKVSKVLGTPTKQDIADQYGVSFYVIKRLVQKNKKVEWKTWNNL